MNHSVRLWQAVQEIIHVYCVNMDWFSGLMYGFMTNTFVYSNTLV